MAKKGEAKVTFNAEVSGFTDGVKQINKSLGNLKSDLKVANAELKANGDSFEALSDKQKILKKITEENAKKMELLQKKLASCKKHLGENSNEYQRLYKQLNNVKSEQIKFTSELKETEKALDGLSDEAEKATEQIDDLGDELKNASKNAKTSKGGFTVMKGALANLASQGIEFALEGLSNFVGYLLELPEATEEFRNNIAKLQGATQQYGYDMEQTNELMKEMYGYFGDEQMATNAITNLQGLGLSQTELNTTLDAGVAVWTAYGDSIPIESLTESINETSQVGKVTGVLADALNWAGISEDQFNEKLKSCKNTQERAKLVTDTLNDAYSESKSAFDNATQGAREAKEAEYDLMEQQSKTAEAIQPLATELDNLKAKLLDEFNPAIEETSEELTDVVKGTSEWMDELNEFNETGLGQMLSDFLIGAPLWLGDYLLGISANKEAQKKWNDELQAEKKVLGDIKNALYWMGDVYDGVKNQGMSFFDAMEYATDKWGDNTKGKLSEVEQVNQEKFDMMKHNAKTSSTASEDAVKTSLNNSQKKLEDFDPNWKISKPKTTEAEQQREKLLNNTTSKLTSFKPSWAIPKPNTSKASDTSWLSTIRTNLSSFKPSWSIPKPKLPKVSVGSKTVGVGNLSIPIPTFSVSWNALGGIFKKPTIFNTSNGLQGVGEAGAEAILPLDSFYNHLDMALNSMAIDYDKMAESFITAMSTLGITINIDGMKVAEAIARSSEEISHTRQTLYERGVNI